VTLEDALREVREKPLVDIWPTMGLLIGAKNRCAAYDAAARGDIETVNFGRRKKVISSALRQKLKIED